ncbi:S-layer homology domain-containing protein [Peptococcus simiae]|uniref:S-layer homology domain-containing protein n=1 Tax=Peptococcus simiae TaxID=1643805 RepID=UPI00397FAF2B
MKKHFQRLTALLLAAGMVLGSIQPALAQGGDSDAQVRKQLIQQADDILKNKQVLGHLLGTNYLHDRSAYLGNPGINPDELEEINGKKYLRDSILVPKDVIDTTPWYQLYQTAAVAKIKAPGLEGNELALQINKIQEIEQIYGLDAQQKLTEDGDYSGPWKAVKVVQTANDGNQAQYQATGEDMPDITELFKEMQLVKWGNDLDLLFVANDKKVSSIKSMVINKVAGKEIRPSIDASDPAEETPRYNLLGVLIPAELKGHELVVESMTYTTATGLTKNVGPFGISINYEALTKTADNTDRFSRYTQARAKYWILRGQTLLNAYLELDQSPDKERAEAVQAAIIKLQKIRNQANPSMTEVIQAAQPIYEVENIYTLLEKVQEKAASARENLADTSLLKKYTKESVKAYEKYLDDLEKRLANLDLAGLVYEESMLDNAYSNVLLKFNTERLEKLIVKAKKYEEKYYTETSFATLKLAIAKSEAWVEKNKSIHPPLNQTSDWYSDLEKALKALEAKPGQMPPVIPDEPEPGATPQAETYEVPVATEHTDISSFLEGKALYSPSENKFTLSFKVNGKNGLTEVKYFGDNYTPAKVVEKKEVDGKSLILKAEIPANRVLSNSIWCQVTYLSLGYPMTAENVAFKFDLDKKKLIGGSPADKPTKPYQVTYKVVNEDAYQSPVVYADKLLDKKAVYDPKAKTVTIKHFPAYEGIDMTSYIQSIEYNMGSVVGPAEKINTTQDGLADAFVFKHDMDKGNEIKSIGTTVILREKGVNGQYTEKKKYDSLKFVLQDTHSKSSKEELKEALERLDYRFNQLKADFNRIKVILSNKGEVDLPNTIPELLKKAETVDKTDLDAVSKCGDLLENACLDIQPWTQLLDCVIQADQELADYDANPRMDKASLGKAQKQLEEIKAKLKAPVSEVEASALFSQVNDLQSLLRLDPKPLEDKIKEAEEKIASGKYEDEGLARLKEILYAQDWAPETAERDKHTKGALGFLNSLKGVDGDGVALDTDQYNSWLAQVDAALQALVGKSAAVDTSKLDQLIKLAQEKMQGNKSKEVFDRLQAAIKEAQTSLKAAKSDKDVDAAMEKLTAAIDEFETSLDEGETAAKRALADLVDQVKGKEKGKKTQAAFDTLQEALKAAEKVLETETGEEKLTAATQALSGALKAFEDSADEIVPPRQTDVDTVLVTMLQAKKDLPSMAEEILWNKAKRYKEGGKTWLELQFVPMTHIPNMGGNRQADAPGGQPTITGLLTKLELSDGAGGWALAETLKSQDFTFPEKNKTVTGLSRVRLDITDFSEKDHAITLPIRITYYSPALDNGTGFMHSPEARLMLNLDPSRLVKGFDENEFVVDKGGLTKLIDSTLMTLNYLDKKSVSPTILENLKIALKTALEVEKDPKATGSAVERAYTGLMKKGQAIALVQEIKQRIISETANLESDRRSGAYSKASLDKIEEVIGQVNMSLKDTSDPDALRTLLEKISKVADLLRYDMTGLQNKIAEGEKVLEKAPASDAKKTLETAIDNARQYMASHEQEGKRTGDKREDHLKALDKAILALKSELAKVDKADLRQALEAYKATKAQDYTDESFAAYTEAYNQAKAVYDQKDADQAAVNQALAKLNAAKDKLQKKPAVHKEALKEAMDQYEALDKSGYTEASLAAYKEAYDQAKAVYLQKDADQPAVDSVLEGLKAAKEALVEKVQVNKADLKKALDTYEATKAQDYTSESFAGYTAAYSQAKAVYDQADADQASVNLALEDLNAAKDALQKKPEAPKADKAALKVALTAYEDLEKEGYTEESLAAYTEAYLKAKAAYEEEEADQVAVDQAAEALNAAQAALVKKPTKPVVNKVALKAALEAYEKTEETSYTEKSFAAYTEAYKQAKAVYNQTDADQTKVNQVLDRLNEAKAALVKKSAPEKVNKGALTKAVTEARKVQTDKYTNKTKVTFIEALKAAEAVLENPRATAQEVQEALAALNKAKDGLVRKSTGSGHSGGGSSWNPAPVKPTLPVKPAPEKPKKDPDKPSQPAKKTLKLAGYPDGSFRPDVAMNRAEVAALLARLLPAGDKVTFSDVAPDAWYATAVGSLQKAGLLGGYPDGTFRADKTITRAEFISLLARWQKLSPAGLSGYTDVPTDHWAASSIGAAVKAGWAKGTSGHTFSPEAPLTRAQAVVILNHALNISVKDGAKRVSSFTDLPSSHWAYADIMANQA